MAGLVLSLFIAGNYGMTWDDQGLWDYADHTIQIYREALRGNISNDPGPANLRYYGPAFLTFERLGENAMLAVFPHLSRTAVWQASIFLTFLIGVASLYSIGSRLFSQQVVLGIVVLFATQPLIWGHAFINGKDMPFLGFFLLSVALGLKIEDAIPKVYKPKNPIRNLVVKIRKDWANLDSRLHRRLIGIFALLVILTIEVFLFPAWPEEWIREGIQFAAANPSSLVGVLFTRLASNATSLPLENYVQKTLRVVQAASVGLVLLFWLVLLGGILRRFSNARKWIVEVLDSIPYKTSARFWRSPAIWVAGLVLAIAIAIRVVAPFAALVVGFYLLNKKGWAALPALLPYLVIAAIGAYFLWPYLWLSPIKHFWNSLTVMSNFPQPRSALFNGQIIPTNELPFYYLPELLLIQFTLPALLLILIGLWLLVTKKGLWKSQKALINALFIWLGLPLAYAVVFTPSMYDNFRQWLFIIPPIFILSGFALQELVERFRNVPGYWAAILLIGLSGIIPIAKLHPYEYIYYNQLVGGITGANGKFELDYWATAFTEATRQLNEFAPTDSRVVVFGQELIVQHTARPDLLVEGSRGGTYDVAGGYHYAIINLAPPRSINLPFPSAPIVVTVSRMNIPLAIIKELPAIETLE